MVSAYVAMFYRGLLIVGLSFFMAVATGAPVSAEAPAEDDGAGEVHRNRVDFPKNRHLYVPIPIPQRKEGPDAESGKPGRTVTYDVATGRTIMREPAERSPLLGKSADYVPGGAGVGRPDKHIGSGERMVPQDFGSLIQISDPSQAPWCQSVKLFIIDNDVNSNGVCDSGETCYEGSGTLIDPKHVVTAGHCIHEGDGGDFFDVVTVVPGYEDGSRPYGDARSLQLHTWEGWADSGTWGHDVGVVDLDRPIGALTGWQGYGHNNSTSFYYGNTFTSAGYPGDTYDGQYLYYWFGDFDFVWDKHVSIFNRGYHGQSGSGARKYDGGGPVVYAVHSSGTEIDTTNFTRITEDKFNDIRDNFIANDRPSSPDLVALNVKVRPSVIRSGDALESISYVIHNYSSATWSDRIYVEVYLSDDDGISTSDTLLDTHHFTVTLDPLESITTTLDLVPPTIPAATFGGDYFVGIVLDVDDYRSSNNDSDGQDAAPLRVSACRLPFTPSGITLPDEDCDGEFTIRWPVNPSMNSYTLERSTSPTYANADVIYEGMADTYEESLSVDTYYYRVRATNDCGSGDWKDGGPVTVMTLDPPAGIVYPPCDCDGSFSVSWSEAPDADYYELYRSSDPYFVTKDVEKVYSGSNLSYTETDSLSGKLYYRVRSVRNFCGRSEYRTGASLTMGGKVSAPASMDCPGTDHDGTFDLTWEGVVSDDPITYTVQRSTSGLFPDPATVYSGSDTSCSVTELEDGEYYFRVRASSPCSTSNWRLGSKISVERPPYDGIWKDDGAGISFFIQTYTEGSVLALITADMESYAVFIDPDVSNGIDVKDYGKTGYHLSLAFTDESHGEAVLTGSGSVQSWSLSKFVPTPDTPANHGIWKTPSCESGVMSYFVQTYKTGSAIAIGTPDLVSFYVFLDKDASDGMDVDELSGKPYHLTMSFLPLLPSYIETMSRCTEAPDVGSSAPSRAGCSLDAKKK